MTHLFSEFELDSWASDPVSPAEGECWYNSTEERMKLRTAGGNNAMMMVVNAGASTNPGVTDDVTGGYSEGSVWINTTADTAWVCVDPTDGAAVWIEITAGAGATVVTAAAVIADNAVVRGNGGARDVQSSGITISDNDEMRHAGTVEWDKGADIASAAALILGTDGNYFDVTGTTSITSVAAKPIGTRILLQFDGIVTVTHHATNLILATGANFTTAAGNHLELVNYDGTNWREVNRSTAGGGSTDADAIHDNVAAEISAVTEKTAPVAADLALIEDSAASNAKKRIQLGNIPLASQIVEATGAVTTTSSTDVLVTSMTITPASGTYLVWFSGAGGNTGSENVSAFSIWSAGSQVASSERLEALAKDEPTSSRNYCCVARVTVNGSQAIEGRFRADSGTARTTTRNLMILKVD